VRLKYRNSRFGDTAGIIDQRFLEQQDRRTARANRPHSGRFQVVRVAFFHFLIATSVAEKRCRICRGGPEGISEPADFFIDCVDRI
jgi:hypothetical protein